MAKTNDSLNKKLLQAAVTATKAREIKDCGSLREDFYTRFKPKNKGFGAVIWQKRRRQNA